jgi:hypothetical protein
MPPRGQKSTADRSTPAGQPWTRVQFSDAEVAELLGIIRVKKPIGNDMWKEVEREWNALASTHEGFTQRPALLLKQKFTRLVDTKKATGDPNMPQLVRHAKHMNYTIQNKIAAGEIGIEEELPAAAVNTSVMELLQTRPEQGAPDS